jgi:hypothetical protein
MTATSPNIVPDRYSVLAQIAEDTRAIRESQERTEKLVTDFITSMNGNPMLNAMAGMMGGGKRKG